MARTPDAYDVNSFASRRSHQNGAVIRASSAGLFLYRAELGRDAVLLGDNWIQCTLLSPYRFTTATLVACQGRRKLLEVDVLSDLIFSPSSSPIDPNDRSSCVGRLIPSPWAAMRELHIASHQAGSVPDSCLSEARYPCASFSESALVHV